MVETEPAGAGTGHRQAPSPSAERVLSSGPAGGLGMAQVLSPRRTPRAVDV